MDWRVGGALDQTLRGVQKVCGIWVTEIGVLLEMLHPSFQELASSADRLRIANDNKVSAWPRHRHCCC